MRPTPRVLLCLLLCSTAACDAPLSWGARSERTDAIIGGSPCDTETFPTAGALLYAMPAAWPADGVSYQFLCSAVLVAPDAVLTAGHCVASAWTPVTRYYFTRAASLDGLAA